MFTGVLRFDTPTARLRAVAFLEGLSFVLLVGVAMPLKYLAHLPLAVTVVGTLHGALFVWLAVLVQEGMAERGRSVRWALTLGLASLIPFGTFFLDRRLGEEDRAYRASLEDEAPR